jgi:hypothetical protein
MKVELAITSGPAAVAGRNTSIRFKITPGDGLEKYLGAWGHMLAASDDLIDMMHTLRLSPTDPLRFNSILLFHVPATIACGCNSNAPAS